MTLTNEHDIDEVIALAIANDPYEKRGDISVTTLVRPPQMVALERQHEGEIETDASEGLWLLLGRAAHYVIEQASEGQDGWLVEEPLATHSQGWTVTGTPDLWRPLEPDPERGLPGGGELVDFKITSAWSFLLEDGVKPDWEQQLNLYAFMLGEAGYSVTKLTILAILRDHMRSKAKADPDYPAIAFQSVTVPLWPVDERRRFLNERVRLHQAAADGRGWPDCTDEERWAKPEKFAVMKRGRKRAVKLFDGEGEAELWKGENSRPGESLYIEHRPGAQTRCEGYCSVARWCEQAQRLGVVKEGVPA